MFAHGWTEDKNHAIQASILELAHLRQRSEATPRGGKRPGQGKTVQEGKNTPQLRVLTDVCADEVQRCRAPVHRSGDTPNQFHEVGGPR
jgi:hypothetical protein